MRRTHVTVTTLAAALVVLVTTVSLGALGLADYLAKRSQEWGRLRIAAASKADELSAALPLWSIDRAQVEKMIASQLEDPDVQTVVVRHENPSAPGGRLTFAWTRDADGRIVTARPPPSRRGLLVEERQVKSSAGESIGSVELYMTPRYIEKNLSISLQHLTWVILLLDLLLSASICALLWWTVLKPLRRMEQYAASVWPEMPGSSSLAPAPGRYASREIRNLHQTIEQMVRQLHARMEMLCKKELMLSTVIDAVPHCVFWKDRNGVYLGGNDALVETVGVRDISQIIGKSDFELPWADHEAEAYCADDQEVLANNRPKRHISEQVRHADGRVRWLDTTKVPLVDPGGVTWGVLGVAEDITERKEAEDALRDANRFTEQVIASVQDGLVVLDHDLRYQVWNPKIEEISGLRADEVLGKEALKEFPFLGDSGVYDLMKRALAGETGLSRDFYARVDRTGREGWAWQTVGPLRSASGEIIGVISTIRDITERKEAEEAVRREKALTDAIFDSMPGLLYMYDDQGRLVRWNGKARGTTGDSEEKLRQSHLGDYQPEEDRQALMEAVQKVMREGEASVEAHMRTRNGLVPYLFTGVRVVIDGRPHLIGVGVDITERKKVEEDLRRALEQAEAANRAKDRFLAAASHELRTPLTPVLLLSSSLEKDPELPEEVRRDLGIIREHVEVERRLIGDLLDFTAIHAGKLHVHPVPCDLHDVLLAAVRTCREDADRMGVHLDVRLDARRHETLGDPDRLRQVFWNLLQNSCKFTPPGGIVTVCTTNDEGNSLRVEVTDTGRGMEPETLHRLFRPFEQGPRDGRMQHYGGLGLGLAISKALVEANGGSISAASPGLERGSTFIVRLPVIATTDAAVDVLPAPPPPASAAPDPPPAAPDPTPRLKLLVVEDHPLTLKTLSRLLTQEGHEVATATTVDGALRAAGQQAFDLVISDIGLPDGSGLDLMRTLRQRHGDGGPPGIALSGFGADADLDASREAGFLAHLTKPVTIEALRDALAQFAAARPDQATPRTMAG